MQNNSTTTTTSTTYNAAPWTAAYEAPLPMGFSRQEYWSGLPLPSLEEGLSSVQLLSRVRLCATP